MGLVVKFKGNRDLTGAANDPQYPDEILQYPYTARPAI